MKIETFIHRNVLPDGTFTDQDGTVEVKSKIIMSQNNGGCNLKECKCSEGHWITIVLPRTKDEIVEGVKVLFSDNAEMQKFFKDRELVCR